MRCSCKIDVFFKRKKDDITLFKINEAPFIFQESKEENKMINFKLQN